MADVEMLVTPGLKELTGTEATLDALQATLQPLNRDGLIRHAIRVLNGLAADRRTQYADDQEVFVRVLAPNLQAKYREFVKRSEARVRLLHPAQQLVLIHAAARYAKTEGGRGLWDPDAQAAWALACLQINDHLMKAPVPPAGTRSWENALYLFSEDAGRWELMNPSRPDRSLARLRPLLTQVAGRGPAYGEAAAGLREAFATQLGMEFETAFNLTAFLIFHWHGQSEKLSHDPDAALINRSTWLQNSTIPLADFDRYLHAVALHVDDIPGAFDALGVGMSFREVLPFRRRPLLRIGEDGVAYLCPQFVSEKGGVDLLWLLTNPPGGARETRMWTDYFGVLYEGYVHRVLEEIGPRLGGSYVPDVTYAFNGEQGQIDSLVWAGNVLAVIEAKGSLIRQTLLTHGSVEEVRDDLMRKFVEGGNDRKGVSQLVHAIHWLYQERRQGNRPRGIDLSRVDTILPVLVVADRYLRYPGLGQWFDYQFSQRLRPVWGRVHSLIICGTEDLEDLEHLACRGGPTVMESLMQYAREVRRGARPLWATYSAPKEPHPRLDRIAEAWLEELRERKILLR